MGWNAQGQWVYEDASVAPRVTDFLRQENPLIAQARSQGLAAANRRGLLNSSMAVGAAQGEAYKLALPIASQEATQIHQTNLAEQERNTQLERLRTDAGFAADRQGADIAAQMARLREQAGFSLTQLNRQGEISTEQQQRELAASMERQRESGAQALTQQERGFGFQTQLNAQDAARRMEELRAQLSGADAQQTRQIEADMARLRESGAQTLTQQERGFGFQSQLQAQAGSIDRQRIELQGNIEKAMQATGAEQQRALATLQGQIQIGLQTLANDQQLGRMAVEFQQQTATQAKEQEFALARLKSSGDQELVRLAAANEGENQRLAMNIAAGDRERIAQSVISIFQSEANMRAALLNNPSMPAAERAAYEAAISSLGNPARLYINQLYTPPAGGAAAPLPSPSVGAPGQPASLPPAGLNAGGAIVTTQPVPGGPSPAGGIQSFQDVNNLMQTYYNTPPVVPGPTPTPYAAPTGLNAGGALNAEEIAALNAAAYQQALRARGMGLNLA